jgi:hypothetical protein
MDAVSSPTSIGWFEPHDGKISAVPSLHALAIGGERPTLARILELALEPEASQAASLRPEKLVTGKPS